MPPGRAGASQQFEQSDAAEASFSILRAVDALHVDTRGLRPDELVSSRSRAARVLVLLSTGPT
jgi:hypothetical protein